MATAQIECPPMPPLPSTEIELRRSKNLQNDYQSQRPREARSSNKRIITSWATVMTIVASIGATWLLSESRKPSPDHKRDTSIAKVKLRPSQRNHLNQEIQKLCNSNRSQIETALRQHRENKKSSRKWQLEHQPSIGKQGLDWQLDLDQHARKQCRYSTDWNLPRTEARTRQGITDRTQGVIKKKNKARLPCSLIGNISLTNQIDHKPSHKPKDDGQARQKVKN